MEISERSFQLVVDQLAALDHTGPVGLSCDDTKLFSTLRLYWDAQQQSYFLVGGVDGPYRVADADQVKKVIADAKIQKASKVRRSRCCTTISTLTRLLHQVRLWCVTVPLPKVTPIIVAAMPIANDLSAETLLPYLLEVLDGLIDRGVQVVSYACDGTEVERSVQRLLVDKADRKIEHVINNPNPGGLNTNVTIAVYRGQPMCMIQDSKHALKTFRNNLFSGARLLTLGSYMAMYRHIAEMAREDGSPLYHRDVENLDRQDDNAAA
jgi:hypothetical protein